MRRYPSTAVSLTHPARLGAFALFHGLSPAFSPRFRYLELGCGDAANLLPMAAQFPEATFVGVDADAAVIERGRRIAAACGIANVALVAADVRDHEPEGDPFDFVVAHGVYSWVPADVQERLLAICARHLAPSGVAYLSYNTFPGWAVRGLVRHVMRDAAGSAIGDDDRLRAAKSRVAELRRFADPARHPYTALLAAELSFIEDKADGYLLGEHLADHNEPVYFKEMARRAGAHGLAYLCEAMPATAEGELEIELPIELSRAGMARVDAEQALDMLSYRQLRATLFCHEGAAFRETADLAPAAHAGCFAARLVPAAAEPLLGPGKLLRFRARSGAEIEAQSPLLKATLLALAEAWPEALTARSAISTAMGLLRERGLLDAAAIGEGAVDETVRDLVELCRRRFVELLPWSPPIHREVSAKPAVSPLTRLEAAELGVVTTPLHEPEPLGEPTRTIAALLDGTRDLRALVAALSARIDSGELTVDAEIPRARRPEILAQLCAAAVGEIRALGLLIRS